MRYVRDEVGESTLGVYHGPLEPKENPFGITDILGNNDISVSDVVEDLNRVLGVRFNLRDHSGPLGGIRRVEDGTKAG